MRRREHDALLRADALDLRMEDLYQLTFDRVAVLLDLHDSEEVEPEGSEPNRRVEVVGPVDTHNSLMSLHDEFRDALLLSDTGQYRCDPRLQLAREQIADWVPLQEAGVSVVRFIVIHRQLSP